MPPIELRERVEFLPKGTRYVFSIDLRLAFDFRRDAAERGSDRRIAVRLPTADELAVIEARKPGDGGAAPPPLPTADTYHVLDDELTTTMDGKIHELPLARATHLHDRLSVRSTGVVDLNGRCRLVTDDGADVLMAYAGVIHLGFRGAEALFSPGAAASGGGQISAQFETTRPRYRWLTQEQFIGFGRAEAVPVPASASAGAAAERAIKILTLSIDLYSAM